MTDFAEEYTIKDVHIHDGVMLITAGDNSLWVQGSNAGKKLGVDSAVVMKNPVKTEIQLHNGETVIKLYQRGYLLMIHTSHKRLFISRVLKPTLRAPPGQGMSYHETRDDYDGLYPCVEHLGPAPLAVPCADRLESESQLPPVITLESDRGQDSTYPDMFAWPDAVEPQFAMPYTTQDLGETIDTHTPTSRPMLRGPVMPYSTDFDLLPASRTYHNQYRPDSTITPPRFSSHPYAIPLRNDQGPPEEWVELPTMHRPTSPDFHYMDDIDDTVDMMEIRQVLREYRAWDEIDPISRPSHPLFETIRDCVYTTLHSPTILVAIAIQHQVHGLLRTRAFVDQQSARVLEQLQQSPNSDPDILDPINNPDHPYYYLIQEVLGHPEYDLCDFDDGSGPDTDGDLSNPDDYDEKTSPPEEYDTGSDSDGSLGSYPTERVRPSRTYRGNDTDEEPWARPECFSQQSPYEPIDSDDWPDYGNYHTPRSSHSQQVVRPYVSESTLTRRPVTDPRTTIRPELPTRAHTFAKNCAFEQPIQSDFSTGNFGLGSASASNEEFRRHASRLRSVHYASRPGFNEPLLDIDELTCVCGTIFFRRGTNHYIYDWRLTTDSAIWKTALALSPIQHDHTLTYYQIHWPCILDSVEYSYDLVYARSCSMNHVLTASTTHMDDSPLIHWYYFQCENITASDILIAENHDILYVYHSKALYEYLHITKTLEQIVAPNDRAFLIREVGPRGALICGVPKMSDRLFFYDNNYEIKAPMGDLVKYILGIHHTLTSDLDLIVLLRIESDTHALYHKRFIVRGDAICLNLSTMTECIRIHNGVAFVDRDGQAYFCIGYHPEQSKQSKYERSYRCASTTTDYWSYGFDSRMEDAFELVETIVTTSCSFNIYQWINLPAPGFVSNLQHNQFAVNFKASNQYYSCMIPGWNTYTTTTSSSPSPSPSPSPYTPITLKSQASARSAIQIDKTLVHRHRPSSTYHNNSISISIQTCSDRLDKLVSMAEMFHNDTAFAITFDRRSQVVSFGDGPKLIFVQDALSQFASVFLTQHQTCTSFNLEAFSDTTAPKLYAYGRMLHLAMTITGTCLSIRLPISLLAAIKGSVLSIPELEFFVEREIPETFKTIRAYDNDPAALADCGYSSYRECLETLVHSSDSQSRIKAISQEIARGITDFRPIENLNRMNIPTLDYYMSGDYKIDRLNLKSRLQISFADTTGFVHAFIDTLLEQQLAILLRNWTGTSVLLDRMYRVEKGSDLMFQTCSATLVLPRALLDPIERGYTLSVSSGLQSACTDLIPSDSNSTPFTHAHLIELLTTPVAHVIG